MPTSSESELNSGLKLYHPGRRDVLTWGDEGDALTWGDEGDVALASRRVGDEGEIRKLSNIISASPCPRVPASSFPFIFL